MKDIHLLFNKFQKIINNNKLSHLYLIEGGHSFQRKQLVIEIAYEIFKKSDSNPQLKYLVKNICYPNFYYLKNQGDLIKKEEIMDLKQYFGQTSLFNKKRIYVIENIENTTIQAGNSLLNFLENPYNEHTVGFLLTNNLSKVLTTIVSRSQVFSLKCSEFFYYQKLKSELKKEGLGDIDAALISLILKKYIKYPEIDFFINSDYYQNFKKTFLEIILFFEQKKELRFLFLYNNLLKSEDKNWLRQLLFCLMRFFVDVLHKKNNLYFYFSEFLFSSFFMNLTLENLDMIFDCLSGLYKQIKELDTEELFLSLLIELDEIRKKIFDY